MPPVLVHCTVDLESESLVSALPLSLPTLPPPFLLSPLLQPPPLLPQVLFPGKDAGHERTVPVVMRLDARGESQPRPLIPLIAVSVRAMVVTTVPVAVIVVAVVVSVSAMTVSIAVAVAVSVVAMAVVAARVSPAFTVLMVVLAAGAAVTPREYPQHPPAPAASPAPDTLGVLLIVLADRGGLAHLADARPAGGLAPKERPAHLHDPAVDGRGLLAVATAGPLFLLLGSRAVDELGQQ